MNSKERVLTAIAHEVPDRVPITNRFTPEIASRLAEIVEVDPGNSFELEAALGHDLLCTKEIGIVNTYAAEYNKRQGDEYSDEFKVVKRRVRYEGGSYLEIVRNPLENLDDWSKYQFPDPDKQESLQKQYRQFEKDIDRFGGTHAIVGGVTCTVFEGAEILRGMSRLMVDLLENEGFVNELLDKMMHYHFRVGSRLIELGVDVLYIGDDAGSQRGMLISPEMWRKFLKPRYDFLFREWRKLRSDIVIAFHSDGNIESVVPDFVEIGLDVLNPVQPGCMDDTRLKREFGDKLTFWGGMNVQKTIPFGTPDDVVAEVRDRYAVFGGGGGFIISSSHNVQPNIRSIDNTLSYYWACSRYGRYRNGETG